MQPLLVLRLEGVLQSWGESSKWNYRDTAVLPTKSGIIGMIGCAFGWQRNDSKLAELNNCLYMGVRTDRPGIVMIDYHTVQSKHLLNAKGKHRGSTGQYSTLVTRRCYLQDAYFTVALQGEQVVLERILNALQHPKWPLYLGKKSCIPSRPVWDGIYRCYHDIEEALQRLPLAERKTDIFIIEVENKVNDLLLGTKYNRNDAMGLLPRSFFNREVVRRVISHKTEGGEDYVSQ